MAVNELGNDAKNNIMWNKEYPFVPELVNDKGEVFHENDPIFYRPGYWLSKPSDIVVQGRITKMYNKDKIIIYAERESKNYFSYGTVSLNEVWHNNGPCKVPIEDLNGWDWYNIFSLFLTNVYCDLYGEDILDDPEKFHKIWKEDLERIHQLK